MENKLHIVFWDIPFPADYGGVIDAFYRLQALHQAGMDITIHCFQYGERQPNTALEKYCSKIFYYPRTTGWRGLHASLPYIVSSRSHPELLKNLCMDNAPILFEGIHTTYFLNDPKLDKRHQLIRTHNVESAYYAQLSNNTKQFFKKIYYAWESNRLAVYEKSLQHAQCLFPIAKHDTTFFQNLYPKLPVIYIAAFHPFTEVISAIGKGNYCLYHGNLQIAENEKAAQFLIQEVFANTDFPLVIAGKNPSKNLMRLQSKNIQIMANPSDSELNEWIVNAHIHVLPSFQTTGLKLKLLHALFAGRHCIANAEMLTGSYLEDAVILAKDANDFKKQIDTYMKIPFTEADKEKRKQLLQPFSNALNAQKIISKLH